jgi:hypothetical protein
LKDGAAFWDNAQRMALIGKLFGRSKAEPIEVKDPTNFASDKLFRRAVKRIFAKYKGAIQKLEP